LSAIFAEARSLRIPEIFERAEDLLEWPKSNSLRNIEDAGWTGVASAVAFKKMEDKRKTHSSI
jgi:hypothetical protein